MLVARTISAIPLTAKEKYSMTLQKSRRERAGLSQCLVAIKETARFVVNNNRGGRIANTFQYPIDHLSWKILVLHCNFKEFPSDTVKGSAQIKLQAHSSRTFVEVETPYQIISQQYIIGDRSPRDEIP